MSRFLELARQAEFGRLQRQRVAAGETGPANWASPERPFRVIAIASNKGGVGKTTVTANLAVYLRKLRPELPILAFGFDDQNSLDRILAFDPEATGPSVADGMRSGSFRNAIRLGRFGVHHVASSEDLWDLKREISEPWCLQRVLLETRWQGLVLVDTKSDFEILTTNALAAGDLTLVPVSDHASLREARRIYRQLEAWNRPLDQARILLTLVDLRVKFPAGDGRDVLSLLVSEIRDRGYPLLESFLSRSPKVEALQTNPGKQALSILKGARGTIVHRQMLQLAEEVLTALHDDRKAAPHTQPHPNLATA